MLDIDGIQKLMIVKPEFANNFAQKTIKLVIHG